MGLEGPAADPDGSHYAIRAPISKPDRQTEEENINRIGQEGELNPTCWPDTRSSSRKKKKRSTSLVGV